VDLFITNLDSKTEKGKLKELLTPVLVHVFDIFKGVGKTFASLTIIDISKTQQVLVSASLNPSFSCSPSGRHAYFRVSDRRPNDLRLKALAHEERNRNNPKAWQRFASEAAKGEEAPSRKLKITKLQCGRWEHENGPRCSNPTTRWLRLAN
jgi:hypothetical protein